MARWKNYSINPLERIMIVHDKELSSIRCLYCGQFLRSKYQLCNNDAGYHTCSCGYENHFEPVDDFLWEVRLVRNEPTVFKKKDMPPIFPTTLRTIFR